MENSKQALITLGVKGKISVIKNTFDLTVYVNGKYFGIFDKKKNTFVD